MAVILWVWFCLYTHYNPVIWRISACGGYFSSVALFPRVLWLSTCGYYFAYRRNISSRLMAAGLWIWFSRERIICSLFYDCRIAGSVLYPDALFPRFLRMSAYEFCFVSMRITSSRFIWMSATEFDFVWRSINAYSCRPMCMNPPPDQLPLCFPSDIGLRVWFPVSRSISSHYAVETSSCAPRK